MEQKNRAHIGRLFLVQMMNYDTLETIVLKMWQNVLVKELVRMELVLLLIRLLEPLVLQLETVMLVSIVIKDIESVPYSKK